MSNLRLSGLASGMDTDSMIQSLMKVERLKVDRYEQSKQIALWRQEAYNSMNKTFANFILNTRKDMGLTKVTSTGLALGNSYTNLDYIRKATSSNETAATVSSTSKAVNGSFELEVKELAKGASLTSSQISKDIKFGNRLEIKLSNEGNVIEVENSEGITMKDIAKAINNAKQGVVASYEVDSYGDGALILQTTETGKSAKIDLQLVSGDNSFIQKFTEVSVTGDDAYVKFNGVDMKYNSNNITLNGVDIQLKKAGETTTIKVDTNIDGIMEKVEKLINDYNELVDKASKTLSEKRYPSYHPLSQEEKKAMHENDAKLWEEKAKSGMLNRDETIQRVLQNARNEIYKTLDNPTGSFKHITEIGITTEKYSRGTTGGKLQIDKDKLREAIEKDPEGVMELLFKDGKFDGNGKEIDKDGDLIASGSGISTKGIFTRVYDNLIDGMKSIIDKSGPGEDSDLFRSVKSNILLDFVTKKSSISDLDKEVLDANKRIDDLNAMLYRKENAYYAKFANMEKMLQQMNSQSSWLAQQFMR